MPVTCITSRQAKMRADLHAYEDVQPASSEDSACNGRLEMDVTFPEFQ
jgi:hypothetical protein